jgi:hypothetical protein
MISDVIILVLLFMAFLWAFSKLLKCIFNLQALKREMKNPGALPRTCGMVLNKKTRKLEADSRPIVPFE